MARTTFQCDPTATGQHPSAACDKRRHRQADRSRLRCGRDGYAESKKLCELRICEIVVADDIERALPVGQVWAERQPFDVVERNAERIEIEQQALRYPQSCSGSRCFGCRSRR